MRKYLMAKSFLCESYPLPQEQHEKYNLITLTIFNEMDFKVGGTMEYWKVLSATMVGWQEKFSNSRRSRMVKTIIFWPWWQPFNSFCFETLSLFPLQKILLLYVISWNKKMLTHNELDITWVEYVSIVKTTWNKKSSSNISSS